MMIRIMALIKKDLILLKRNIYTGFAIAIFTPILLGFAMFALNSGVSATITAYLSGVIYTTFILYFYIALEEAKYSKSIILLNSVYTKNEIVNARYGYFLLSILASTGIFILVALLLKNWFIGFSMNVLLISISLALFITSLFIPFTYRWNIDVTKYVLSIFLLILSLGSIDIADTTIRLINSSEHPQLSILLLFSVSIFFLIISKKLSIKYFKIS